MGLGAVAVKRAGVERELWGADRCRRGEENGGCAVRGVEDVGVSEEVGGLGSGMNRFGGGASCGTLFFHATMCGNSLYELCSARRMMMVDVNL